MAVLKGLGQALFASALLVVVATPAGAQSALTQHLHQAVRAGQARFLNPMPATQSLRLDVVLPLRDPAGLTQFLRDIYDPSSPNFHHFLSVSEFTDKFGPSQEDYDALTRYAVNAGFHVVGGTRDGMDLQIEGSAPTVETAFHVSLGVYQHPTEDRTFYSADREPSVSLPFPLWHVSGLDNYSIPKPRFTRKSDAKGRGKEPLSSTPEAVTGSGPSASFLGSDMRAAYYGGTALTGAGQNLGLFEFVGTDLADLNTYFKNAGQTNNVPITLLSTDGTSTSCTSTTNCDDTEQTLDMTQALGMAPGLASLVMYVGNTDTAIISAMTSHNPLPTTISCSWGWTPVDSTTLDPYFQRMAAQGQNFFAASGDASTWSRRNEAWPADDAYVVAVGGTDLTTTGAGGAWKSETAWTDSGGGISPDKITIPAWQQLTGIINASNAGSTIYRNGPDVSANANFNFYVCANQSKCVANQIGGTSFAAPMWAGYLALANQQSVASGHGTLGFINPSIYQLGVGSGYGGVLHDISAGTSGSYSAVVGYDLVTGWGSPNGAGLINALANLPATPNFTFGASPASVSVIQGAQGSTSVSTTVSGGFNSAIVLSAAGQPAGVTVSFSPASIAGPGAGSSTMTMSVAATVAAGNYTITLTGAGGGVSHTATVTLTVTSPAFTLSASPVAVSVAPGAKGTSTITTAVSGGFNAAINLSATGLPAQVTAGFSAASIAAPGSGTSVLTFTVATGTTAGSYPVTVTASGGGISHTTTVTLTVPAPAAPNFTISASPAKVSVAQGASATSTVTTTVSGGFNSAVSLTTSGQPAGVTVTLGSSSISAPGAGSTVLTLKVAGTAAAGTYSIEVTGSGGGVTHTAIVSLTVTSSASFTISLSPDAVSVSRGSSGLTTIIVEEAAEFNSQINLNFSGIPQGVTLAFGQPSYQPGSATLAMTMSVAANAAPGAYPITVTAAGGGTTTTATVTFTVTK